jgi:hypothetical protein
MTQRQNAASRGLEPHWKVRIVFPGVIIHTASWTEPQLQGVDEEPNAEWINDSRYGDILGMIRWHMVIAITWRRAE